VLAPLALPPFPPPDAPPNPIAPLAPLAFPPLLPPDTPPNPLPPLPRPPCCAADRCWGAFLAASPRSSESDEGPREGLPRGSGAIEPPDAPPRGASTAATTDEPGGPARRAGCSPAPPAPLPAPLPAPRPTGPPLEGRDQPAGPSLPSPRSPDLLPLRAPFFRSSPFLAFPPQRPPPRP
jgi:hypothetical protein